MAEKMIIATVCASALAIGPHIGGLRPAFDSLESHPCAGTICSIFIIDKQRFLF